MLGPALLRCLAVLLAAATTVASQSLSLRLAGRPHVGCTIDRGPADTAFAGQRWTNGTVPYAWHPSVGPAEQAAMRAAMDVLEAAANVRFVARAAEPDYLLIRDSTINSSSVGRAGGPQLLHVFNWNLRFVMVHELLHALGFWHEHQRPDRDQWLAVQWPNVDPACAHDFQLVPTANTAGGAYDFDSVMHFGGTEASSNGQPTLLVLPPNQQWQGQIGQRAHLSAGDREGLRRIYGSIVPPTLQSLTPASMPTARPVAVVVTGLLLDEVTRVLVDNVQVPFALLSETQIRFTPPSLRPIGPVPVQVESPTGRSNPLPLQLTGLSPPELQVGPLLLRGTFQNSVAITSEAGLQHLVLAAFDNQPSVLPGVIALGLGSQFTTMQPVVGPQLSDPRGLLNSTLVVPLTVPTGARIWLQCIAYDLGNLTLPVPVSNLVQGTTF